MPSWIGANVGDGNLPIILGLRAIRGDLPRDILTGSRIGAAILGMSSSTSSISPGNVEKSDGGENSDTVTGRLASAHNSQDKGGRYAAAYRHHIQIPRTAPGATG